MITAISNVVTDRPEYSRYYPLSLEGENYSIINVTGTVAGAAGDTVHLSLVKDQTGRFVTKKTALLGSSGTVPVAFTIDLAKDCFDADGIYWATQGTYTVTLSTLVDGAGIAAKSAVFYIMAVSSVEMREQHLKAVPLVDMNILYPRVRSDLTGVTGVSVRDVQRGGYELTWDHTTRELSFANGPAEVIPGSGTVTVDLWDETMDQTITVKVVAASLPVASVDSYVFVDGKPITDAALRGYLEEGYAFMEKFLQIPLEPKLVVTSGLADDYPLHEKIVDSPSFRPSKTGALSKVPLGLRRVIKVHGINGWLNGIQQAYPPAGWVRLDEINGLVSFVPDMSTGIYPAPMLTGYGGFSTYGGYAGFGRTLPHYWQFAATYGLRNLDSTGYAATAREGVMHYAVIHALLVAGRAQAGILSAVSVSRDGASLNKQYTSGQFGVYSDIIMNYSQWFTENGPSLKQQIIGVVVSR